MAGIVVYPSVVTKPDIVAKVGNEEGQRLFGGATYHPTICVEVLCVHQQQGSIILDCLSLHIAAFLSLFSGRCKQIPESENVVLYLRLVLRAVIRVRIGRFNVLCLNSKQRKDIPVRGGNIVVAGHIALDFNDGFEAGKVRGNLRDQKSEH